MTVARLLLSLLVLLIAMLVAFISVLDQSPELRAAWFAKLFALIVRVQSQEMRELRCQLVKDVHSKVLEIGFGTGGTLPCFSGWTNVTLNAIEPNRHFAAAIQETVASINLSFPLTIDEGVAEDLSMFKANSFDFVLSTHVLCSVNSVDEVLDEIHRVLRPGGQFLFIDHVAAAHDSRTRQFQELIARPWAAIGHGCRFRDIAAAVQQHDQQFELQITAMALHSVPFFMSPHVRGVARKL